MYDVLSRLCIVVCEHTAGTCLESTLGTDNDWVAQ